MAHSVMAAGGLVDLFISSREQNLVQFVVFRSETLYTETSGQFGLLKHKNNEKKKAQMSEVSDHILTLHVSSTD